MPDICNKNTGVLIVPLSPKAYVAGIETGIKYEVRLPKADWFNYTPTGERQNTYDFDTMSCATFSALNSIEMQVSWLIANGKINKEVLELLKEQGFFDANGKFNCSDWFTSNMSGTTSKGNDLASVWESIRIHGLLPEKHGKKPSDFKTVDEWLDRSNVTTEHMEKALKFLDIFEVQYEFVLYGESKPEVLAYHLKQAPIHIASPTCNWGGGIIKSCGQMPIGHATCAHGSEDKVATCIYDHYDPMNKKLAWDYNVPIGIKGVLSLKEAKAEQEKPAYVFYKTLKRGDSGSDVYMLQTVLRYFGFFTLKESTRFFGYHTEKAVKAFQAKYASEVLKPIGLTVPTGVFGSMSIKKLNSLLSG